MVTPLPLLRRPFDHSFFIPEDTFEAASESDLGGIMLSSNEKVLLTSGYQWDLFWGNPYAWLANPRSYAQRSGQFLAAHGWLFIKKRLLRVSRPLTPLLGVGASRVVLPLASPPGGACYDVSTSLFRRRTASPSLAASLKTTAYFEDFSFSGTLLYLLLF